MSPWVHSVLHAATDFADVGVMSVLVLAGSLFLWISGCRRGAWIFLVSYAAAVLGIAALKLIFIGCGRLLPDLGIHSPSGHAALATTVFGVWALLASSQLAGRTRWIVAGFAALAIAVIAVSRVMLGFHTPGEVALGLGLGLGIVAMAWLLIHGKRPLPRFDPRRLLVVMMVSSVLLYGVRVPAEPLIRALALDLGNWAPACHTTAQSS